MTEISERLNVNFQLIEDNLNAFRHDKFNELLIRIQYYLKSGLNLKNLNNFLSKLEASFRTVAKNPYVTGEYLYAKSLQERTQILEKVKNPYEVIHYLARQRICHPAILESIIITYESLASLLPRKEEHHLEFLSELEIEKNLIREALERLTIVSPTKSPQLALILQTEFEKKENHYLTVVRRRKARELDASISKIKGLLNTKILPFYTEERKRLREFKVGQIDNRRFGDHIPYEQLFHDFDIIKHYADRQTFIGIPRVKCGGGYYLVGDGKPYEKNPHTFLTNLLNVPGPSHIKDWQTFSNQEDTYVEDSIRTVIISQYLREYQPQSPTNVIVNFYYEQESISIVSKIENLDLKTILGLEKLGYYLQVNTYLGDKNRILTDPNFRIKSGLLLTNLLTNEEILIPLEDNPLGGLKNNVSLPHSPQDILIGYIFGRVESNRISVKVPYIDNESSLYQITYNLPFKKAGFRVRNPYINDSQKIEIIERALKVKNSLLDEIKKTKEYTTVAIQDREKELVYILQKELLSKIGISHHSSTV